MASLQSNGRVIMGRIIVQRRWSTELVQVDKWDPNWLIATARLVHREGNARPYFSLTGETRCNGSNGRIESCGCIHDVIVVHWPELAPLAAIHLSDDQGVPMHALESARYWMGLSGRYQPDDDYGRREIVTDDEGLRWAPTVLASHLRVSVEQAHQLRNYVASDPNESEALHFVIRSLSGQWASEAEQARAIIEGRDQ